MWQFSVNVDNGARNSSLNFGVLDSEGTLTFDLSKIKGQKTNITLPITLQF